MEHHVWDDSIWLIVSKNINVRKTYLLYGFTSDDSLNLFRLCRGEHTNCVHCTTMITNRLDLELIVK